MAQPIGLLQIGVKLLNFGLLLALVVLFIQNYRRLKTPFGLGLILFAAAFALNTLLDLVVLMGRVGGDRVPEIKGLDLIASLLQLLAIGPLIWLATK